MTKREVTGNYRGSLFGLAWSFLNPLIMLSVYTVVFSVVFKARWNTGSDSKVEFALALFIGMIVYSILSDTINKSPGIVLGNANYVKKVVFPLEILTYVSVFTTLFHAMVSTTVWLFFFAAVNHYLNWTTLFFPIVIAPLVIFSFGVSWFLASLGVYVRDIGQITGTVTTALLFLSPLFYPISMLPPTFQKIVYLNPLTFFIQQSRDVMMWGNPPNGHHLALAYFISIIAAWLGFLWFQKTRRGFADVI